MQGRQFEGGDVVAPIRRRTRPSLFPYLVMSIAEAHLLRVSGDRDQQCRFQVCCDALILLMMELMTIAVLQ
jgi:hypothetical protein